MDIRDKLDNKFIKQFDAYDQRIELLEQAVFGKEGAERRFEKIENS